MRIVEWSRGALALVVLYVQGCAGGAHYAKSEAPMPPPAEMAAAPEEPANEGYGYEFEGSPGTADATKRKQSTNTFPGNTLSAIPAGEVPEPSGKPSEQSKRAPLLIYSATLVLSVFEAKAGLTALEAIAKERNGYLVTRDDHQITIRVPAEVFEDTLVAAAKLGDELHREVKVSDVTAEFRDIEIRLQNARAVRARLEELLGKSQNVAEALQVEKELERVSGEIESMAGKLKYYRELISFSTITVSFEARPIDRVEKQVALPFPWLYELGLTNLLSL